MAKIYYNDNGTWKVVDISGGGGGGSSNVVESPLTIGTGIQTLKIHKAGYIEYTNPNQHMKFNLPLYSAQGTVDLLSSESVKTLFGNQSIVGVGNIDLYRHIITATDSGNRELIMSVISSKNLNVKSLTDLKTLLGNTFNYPASGWSSDYNNPDNPSGIITRVTETTIYGINPITHLERTLGTWAGFTITDDVKTV